MDYAGAASRGITHKLARPGRGRGRGQMAHGRGPQNGHTTEQTSISREISPFTPVQELEGDNSRFVGLDKGIEGRNNSCYMDAVLTSTLMTTRQFINFIKPSLAISSGHPLRPTVLKYLKSVSNKIRNPPHFCSFKDIQPLKDVLTQVNSRFNGQMMDVDELITILFGKIFNIKPFIRYSVSTSNFIHQIILPPNSRGRMDNSIHSLLPESISNQSLQGFAEVPNPALLIVMPRSKGKLVGVDFVIPNLFLDITELCPKGENVQQEVIFYLHAVICLKNLHYTAYMFDEESKIYLYYDSMSNANGKSQVWSCPGFENFLDKFTINSQDGLMKNVEGTYQKVLTDCRLCIYLPKTSENSGPSILKPLRSLSPAPSLQSNQKQKVSDNFGGPVIEQMVTIRVAPNPDRSTKPLPARPKIHSPDLEPEVCFWPKNSTNGGKESNNNLDARAQRKIYKERNNSISKDSMFSREEPSPQPLSKSKIPVRPESKFRAPPQNPNPNRLNCLEAIMLGFFKLLDPFHIYLIDVKGGNALVKSSIKQAINVVLCQSNNVKTVLETLLHCLNISKDSATANDPHRLTEAMWRSVSPNQTFISYTQCNSNGNINSAYVHNLIWENCTSGGPIAIQEALINSLKQQELILNGSVTGPGLIISVDRSYIKRAILPTETLDISKLQERKTDKPLKSCDYRLYSVICEKSDGTYVAYHREVMESTTRTRQFVECESFVSKTMETEDDWLEFASPEPKVHRQYEPWANPSNIAMKYGTIYIYVQG